MGLWPARWWASRSLRARLTLVSTALFALAVMTGALLVLVLQRYALVRVLDSSATKSAHDIAQQFMQGKNPTTVLPTTGGVTAVQVVDANNIVVAASPGADRVVPVLDEHQLADARRGRRFEIDSSTSNSRLRVVAQAAGAKTVLVVTDLKSVDDNVRILGRAALIGGPIAVLLMGLATYTVVALTLRSVAELRHSAGAITAAGLADQRLPVPSAQDEIHRLAVTLNAMLDRIDAATRRQRTFVGDAAHELRSPLASLRVQLEVAQRMGRQQHDWSGVVDDVLVDVERLERLVTDLLAVARLDEVGGGVQEHEPVELRSLIAGVVAGYRYARVPVRLRPGPSVTVIGDADGLRRIVVNLVDNAVRAARASVDVALTVGRTGEQETATLVVSDDGPGIPPEERERVFDRFYRMEEARSRESGGTGLGLPIVRGLVRAHGGTVRLDDRPDGPGLRAVVVLPFEAPG